MKKPKPKFLTIRVTAADIENGKPGHSNACPVFLAIKRVRPDILTVGRLHLYFKNHAAIDLPADVKEFTWVFDIGEKVKPQTFKIPLE